VTDVAVETVWKGAEALRSFLVPLADLEPFKGNPRRGDIASLRASLRRWGQVRAILVYENRIVAGHHIVLAAEEEGWTHVAAIPHEFETPGAARDFLLADNRLHDLGSYDGDLLVEQLRGADSLEGTGYTDEDVKRFDAELAETYAQSQEEPPRLDERSEQYSTQPRGFEVPLYLQGETRVDFARWVKLLEHEWQVKGVTDVVVRAVREAALQANS
jgi:ParB-like chromosome segregation protein Spo0J